MEKEVNIGYPVRDVPDLGPVIARADHERRAIEVNASVFYKLPPLMQEFVLVHEVCHLEWDDHDEARTNERAARLFVSRARSDLDRARREEFLEWARGRVADGSGQADVSNFWSVIISAVPAAFGLGVSIYNIVKQYNAGWYSLDRDTQRSCLKQMLTDAFDGSRKTNQKSAAELFWDMMEQIDFKDDNLDKFLDRSANQWVKAEIQAYEKQYGFGFREVTPIDWLSMPAVRIGIVAAAFLATFLIVRKIKTKKK